MKIMMRDDDDSGTASTFCSNKYASDYACLLLLQLAFGLGQQRVS
jgi:hypothetical protein